MMAEKTQEQQFISRNKLARLFGVTPRYISLLVEQGMPQHARGQFDFLRCGMFYARFLTAALKRRGTGSDAIVAQLRRDRIRLVRAQADRAEFESRELLQGLIPADAWQAWEARAHAMIRERLLAMCAELAPQLANKSHWQVRSLIDATTRNTLAEMSREMNLLTVEGEPELTGKA